MMGVVVDDRHAVDLPLVLEPPADPLEGSQPGRQLGDILAERDEQGALVCRHAIIMPGRQYPVSRLACEPMALYFGHDRLRDHWRPLRVTPERRWWHDMTAVLAGARPSPRREMFWERRGDRAARVGRWKWVQSARGGGR